MRTSHQAGVHTLNRKGTQILTAKKKKKKQKPIFKKWTKDSNKYLSKEAMLCSQVYERKPHITNYYQKTKKSFQGSSHMLYGNINCYSHCRGKSWSPLAPETGPGGSLRRPWKQTDPHSNTPSQTQKERKTTKMDPGNHTSGSFPTHRLRHSHSQHPGQAAHLGVHQ